jgi:hypothetical protein
MTVQQVSEAGMARFLDDGFGMFIHWGLYSILARGEWVMHTSTSRSKNTSSSCRSSTRVNSTPNSGSASRRTPGRSIW